MDRMGCCLALNKGGRAGDSALGQSLPTQARGPVFRSPAPAEKMGETAHACSPVLGWG